MWEKALHRWVSGRAKLSTSCAGAAADAHITYVTNVVRLAVSEKPPQSEGTIGEQRLYKDKESAKPLNPTF
jgi:hypothetical protein